MYTDSKFDSKCSILQPTALFLLGIIISSLIGCAPQSLEDSGEKPEDLVSVQIGDSPMGQSMIRQVRPETVQSMSLKDQDEDQGSELLAKHLSSFQLHQGPINSLKSGVDGMSVISGGQDGKVYLLQKKVDGFVSDLLFQLSKPVLALAFSPDGRRVAASSFSSVFVFDIVQRKIISTLTRVRGGISALAWDPRDQQLALGRANGDVYIWNLSSGVDAGLDSERALELYQGGVSPIVEIAFHPSGRAFFVLERKGSLGLWRVLRTEKELGLRDENTIVDNSKEGKKLVPIGSLAEPAQGLWLSADGAELVASGGNGIVRRWKVRGLKDQDRLVLGEGEESQSEGYNLKHSQETLPLLVTGGRNQRLSIWCRNVENFALQRKSEVAVVLSGESDTSLEEAQPVRAEDSRKRRALIIRSEILSEPLDIIETGSGVGLVWASQRSGAVIAYNPNALLKNKTILKRLVDCRQ